MTQVFYKEYIQKVTLLEKKIGAKTSYQIFEPFSLNTRDIVSVQAAAKKIADFIGLKNLTFIVSITRQEDHVGGHIDLNHSGKEVFIEISDNMLNFENSVLTTLAHEITHKYLHINAISIGSGPAHNYENEILTDVAAVFLGLGKLMLNGCDVKKEHVTGDNISIETKKCGYLDRKQLAFVFSLVCSMRNISPSKYRSGLSYEALQALRFCQERYQNFFDNKLHQDDISEKLTKKISSRIEETQFELFRVDKNLFYLQCKNINVAENFLKEKHSRIAKMQSILQKKDQKYEHNPSLRYLDALSLNQDVERNIVELESYAKEIKNQQKNINKLASFAQYLNGSLSRWSRDEFSVVVCRNDGVKIKLPKNKKKLIVTCPQCSYKFAANTTDSSVNLIQKIIFKVAAYLS